MSQFGIQQKKKKLKDKSINQETSSVIAEEHKKNYSILNCEVMFSLIN